MSIRMLILRLLAVLALSFWVGGFTFYGGIVIPLMHEQFATTAVGQVTARATDALNVIGGVTIVLWWLWVWFDRSTQRSWLRYGRVVCLTVTTVLLLAQVVLHTVMDRQLASSALLDFYPLHRAYLLLSTLQWLMNLVLLGLTQLGLPQRAGAAREGNSA